MTTIYALMMDDTRHGPPCAIFQTREDAERHQAELGDGFYVEEVPFYPAGDRPEKTTWFRADAYPHRTEPSGAWERTHWDWYRGEMMDGRDGELNISAGGSGYRWCCSLDKSTAERVVAESLA